MAKDEREQRGSISSPSRGWADEGGEKRCEEERQRGGEKQRGTFT